MKQKSMPVIQRVHAVIKPPKAYQIPNDFESERMTPLTQIQYTDPNADLILSFTHKESETEKPPAAIDEQFLSQILES